MTEKTCKTMNCNNKTIDVGLHWAGDDYCKNCISKKEEQFDSVRDQERLNMQQHGNKLGLIDKDEYWGREFTC
jgi:hypothetical protein